MIHLIAGAAFLFIFGCANGGLLPDTEIKGKSQSEQTFDSSNFVSKSRLPSGKIMDSSGYLYDKNDKSCDGFPKLEVQTMPGTCLGLVLPKDRAVDQHMEFLKPKESAIDGNMKFVKPRVIVQVPNTQDFLITDMGSWTSNNGRLFWLRKDSHGNYSLNLLKFPLDNPHGLVFHTDGYFYIGEKKQISRFHFENGKILDWQIVIANLRKSKSYMHPLSQFTFNRKTGDLLINSGSPSDHCYVKKEGDFQICPEVESDPLGAKILQIPGHLLKSLPAGGIKTATILASGLRNSMAMVVSPSGFLVQGENSRDFPEMEEPYEEINVIDLNKINSGVSIANNYGWPYCYNFHATSPEWLIDENKNSPMRKKFTSPIDCAKDSTNQVGGYQPPYALMPPHVAPLHMDYYQGSKLSHLLDGQLLVTWHGYQPMGHRLVAYHVDEQGLPLLEMASNKLTYAMNLKGANCPKQVSFTPQGGLSAYAPYTEVISGWGEKKGIRPKGAPVSFTVADDGSIWIVEDRNVNTIVRLAPSNNTFQGGCSDNTTEEAIDGRIELLAWRRKIKNTPELNSNYLEIKSQLVDKYCQSCHGGFAIADIRKDSYATLDYIFSSELISPHESEKSKMWQAISRSSEMPPMPPAGQPQITETAEGEALIGKLKTWIDKLPTEVTSTIRRQKMEERRNIRNRPSVEGKKCGVYENGDTLYIEGAKGLAVTEGNFIWIPTYLVPNHSRLIEGACEYPEDGIFYFAVKK